MPSEDRVADQKPKPQRPNTLVEFFRESQLFGVELDLERDKDTGRDIDFEDYRSPTPES